MKIIAQVLSVIFQPMLMPALAIFLLFDQHEFFSYLYVSEFVNRLYLIGFILTIAMPMLSFVVMLRMGIITDIKMTIRKERVVPTYVAVIYYFCFYYLLAQIDGLSIHILSSFLGCILAILIANLITSFWKISIHGIGISSVAAIMVGTSEATLTHNIAWITILLVLIGLVGWSRLYLKRHTPMQVLAGSILGFMCPYLFTIYEITI